MIRRLSVIALWLLALGLVSCSGRKQPDAAASEASATAHVEAIPAADPARYRNLKAKGWQNPYLILRSRGVALLDASNHEERYINPDHLIDILAALPASSWPYGRVVAVTEGGPASEDEKIELRKNRAIVVGTLETMHVAIHWIPSS